MELCMDVSDALSINKRMYICNLVSDGMKGLQSTKNRGELVDRIGIGLWVAHC